MNNSKIVGPMIIALSILLSTITVLFEVVTSSSSDKADEQAITITVITPIAANVFIILFFIIFLFKCIKNPYFKEGFGSKCLNNKLGHYYYISFICN